MQNVSRITIRFLLLLIPLAVGLWWFAKPTQAPEVTLTTLSGNKIGLGQLRGQLVLLNFWASDCPACLQEMPLLARLYEDYNMHGLEVFAVAMPYDPPSCVLSFVKAYPPPYPVVLDPFGTLSQAFDVSLIPTSILIAPDGTMVWRHTGIPDFQRLQPLIETLIPQGE